MCTTSRTRRVHSARRSRATHQLRERMVDLRTIAPHGLCHARPFQPQPGGVHDTTARSSASFALSSCRGVASGLWGRGGAVDRVLLRRLALSRGAARGVGALCLPPLLTKCEWTRVDREPESGESGESGERIFVPSVATGRHFCADDAHGASLCGRPCPAGSPP